MLAMFEQALTRFGGRCELVDAYLGGKRMFSSLPMFLLTVIEGLPKSRALNTFMKLS